MGFQLDFKPFGVKGEYYCPARWSECKQLPIIIKELADLEKIAAWIEERLEWSEPLYKEDKPKKKKKIRHIYDF